jgi:chitin disaccharide deacetylase
MRKIWLCADDYAIAPAVDVAIRDLLARGRLNATSVMVVAPSFSSEAPPLAALQATRRAAIGLHLTLTRPFRPLTAFRPLSDRAFPPLAAMARLAFLRRLDTTALAREIEAQLAAFAAAFGRAPDFVDGHQHVHLFPQIREETLAAVKRAAPTAWVRQCGSALPLRILLRDFKTLALSELSRGFRRRAAARGVAINPAFAGVYDLDPSTDFAALFPRFLDGLPENGLVMCHPGHVDAELKRLDPLTDLRETEYRFFAGDAFPRALAAAGVALASLPPL